MAMDLQQVVHDAVQLPSHTHLQLAAQTEPAQPLVVGDITKIRLYRDQPAAMLLAPLL